MHLAKFRAETDLADTSLVHAYAEDPARGDARKDPVERAGADMRLAERAHADRGVVVAPVESRRIVQVERQQLAVYALGACLAEHRLGEVRTVHARIAVPAQRLAGEAGAATEIDDSRRAVLDVLREDPRRDLRRHVADGLAQHRVVRARVPLVEHPDVMDGLQVVAVFEECAAFETASAHRLARSAASRESRRISRMSSAALAMYPFRHATKRCIDSLKAPTSAL